MCQMFEVFMREQENKTNKFRFENKEELLSCLSNAPLDKKKGSKIGLFQKMKSKKTLSRNSSRESTMGRTSRYFILFIYLFYLIIFFNYFFYLIILLFFFFFLFNYFYLFLFNYFFFFFIFLNFFFFL